MFFSLSRHAASWASLSADLHARLVGQDVVCIAEKVGVAVYLRGHVPGVVSSSTAARFRGAFALTATRVVAFLPTRADPHLRAIDSGWDDSRGPARVTIDGSGVLIDIGLRGVDPGFSGSMQLKYKHALSYELLERLPATHLWCTVDPVMVCRAAGVRPRADTQYGAGTPIRFGRAPRG